MGSSSRTSRPGASSHRPSAPRNPLRIAALLLLTIATGLSLWLAFASLGSGGIPGCDAGDCGAVLTSRWAKIFGVPVGLFGAAVYGILIILNLRPLPAEPRGPRLIAATLVLLIPAAALWFVILQLFVLRAFCPWCTATHVLASTGAVLIPVAWRRDAQASQGKKTRPVAAASLWGPAIGMALVALGGFVLAGVVSPKPPPSRIVTASMRSFTNAAPLDSARLPAEAGTTGTNAGAAATPGADAPRLVKVHGGRFELDRAELPTLGEPNAPHWIVMISDYTCRYCRAAHRTLEEVRASFDPRQLGIIMLPSQHSGDSVEIQRLMLAAWKVDRDIWTEVAHELYGERISLKTEAVREHLSAKLGSERLAASLAANTNWIENLFQLTRDITVANREITRSGSIPQFIIGTEVVVGAPSDAAEFFDLFAKHLNLVRERLPELQLATTDIDLGRVFAGTQQAITIGYSNPGVAALEISRVTLPSGGKVLRGIRTPVAPGATSIVEFAVQVPRDPGPFEQTATLFSNARTSSLPVRLKGTVWKPLTITPQLLDFGRFDPANGSTQAVARIEFEEDARIAAVHSQNPGFAASFREVVPGRAFEVVVATTRSLANGTQQGTVVVELGPPVPPGWPRTIAFAARASVDRAVTAMPPRITLPGGPLSLERHQQILVRCTDRTPDFTVRGAILEKGPAFVRPEVTRGGGTNDYVVQVTLPAGWEPPTDADGARVLIETSHPRYSTLEVPVVVQGR